MSDLETPAPSDEPDEPDSPAAEQVQPTAQEPKVPSRFARLRNALQRARDAANTPVAPTPEVLMDRRDFLHTATGAAAGYGVAAQRVGVIKHAHRANDAKEVSATAFVEGKKAAREKKAELEDNRYFSETSLDTFPPLTAAAGAVAGYAESKTNFLKRHLDRKEQDQQPSQDTPQGPALG